jgi:hypothetical protein
MMKFDSANARCHQFEKYKEFKVCREVVTTANVSGDHFEFFPLSVTPVEDPKYLRGQKLHPVSSRF